MVGQAGGTQGGDGPSVDPVLGPIQGPGGTGVVGEHALCLSDGAREVAGQVEVTFKLDPDRDRPACERT